MADTQNIDGRRQRADDNRRRIAEAMLELLRGGEVAPSAEQVATQAGVGRRTVFRLFQDMEGVYREMHALMVQRLLPMLATPFVSEGRGRLDEIVERRAKMFEVMLPIKAASDAHRHQSDFLQSEHRKLTRLQRDTMVAAFPPAFTAHPEKLEALDLTLSFEAWRRLRMEQRLSVKQAVGVLRRMVHALAD